MTADRRGPFFEGKVSTWEGGFRVPAIFRWPGKVQAGITSAAFATTMDLFTTCAKLAGGTLPTDRTIDGHDLTSVILRNDSGREPLMYYYFGVDLWAIRKGPWKIHFKTTNPASVTKWGAWEIDEHDPPLLFHVEHDPGEQYNIAGDNTHVVAELTRLAQQHNEQMEPGEPQR